MMGPGSGHWVHTKDEHSAKAFAAEQEMRAAREDERAERSREFRRRMWHKVRAVFRRSA